MGRVSWIFSFFGVALFMGIVLWMQGVSTLFMGIVLWIYSFVFGE
jgi:hypothetical protein